jgi:excisionase family DNA binding protein
MANDADASDVGDADDEVLGYRGAARVTGLEAPTLRWLVHLNRIPHLRIGPRTVRFRRRDLRAWLERSYRPAKEG